ncbi:helix-turn-helix domain-containing protein [Pedobacter miscanthi]|jgi:hypothetical protein|uniref:helix-turn-helix domain-containing protein n=1 Tax=Pedobacter miscanthi TaxID=2259170 RepID=UPI00292FEA82|nr:helix-turn-helix domain-containing protein [Pedobacter miscanthi]
MDEGKQIVTVAHLNAFKADLLAEINLIFKKTNTTANKKWLKTREVKKFLELSSGTLQSMRKSGAISFTKIGGSLYYDPDDIQVMLEENKTRSKKL